MQCVSWIYSERYILSKILSFLNRENIPFFFIICNDMYTFHLHHSLHLLKRKCNFFLHHLKCLLDKNTSTISSKPLLDKETSSPFSKFPNSFLNVTNYSFLYNSHFQLFLPNHYSIKLIFLQRLIFFIHSLETTAS